MSQAPPEIGRNEFDEWCWRRGMDLRAGAEAFEVSVETIRLIRLPFTDPKRRVPAKDLAERIHAYTGGEIVPAHFFPPTMRGRASEAEGLSSAGEIEA